MMSARPRAGADRRAALMSWKALSISSVQANGIVSFVAWYGGFAISAKPGIHNLQNPADPRNSLIPR